MTREEKVRRWKALCGLAVELLGSQDAFRKESNVLKRLTKKYGPNDMERALRGAKLLRWRSLLQLGDAEGAGWRWAIEAYWRNENSRRKHGKAPQVLKDILREMVK